MGARAVWTLQTGDTSPGQEELKPDSRDMFLSRLRTTLTELSKLTIVLALIYYNYFI